MLNKGDKGTLEIFREHRKWTSLRTFDILVDGNESGHVEDDDSTKLFLSPGPHAITIKFGWMQSKSANVNIETDKKIDLHISYRRLTGWKLLARNWIFVVLMLVGALFGNGAIIGASVASFMFNRDSMLFE